MKTKPLIFAALTLGFGMMLNGAAFARQLDQYEQQVENQLQRVIQMAKGEGYQLSLPRNVGKLTKRTEAPKTVLLYPNQEYSFVAVCDQNCNQVNLIVKDMSGKRITSDVANAAVAVVNFKPPSEDRYQVAVRMEKCSTHYCNFGLGIFAKR
jgi:2-methylaconitate cis-trans-isomerase PrpF